MSIRQIKLADHSVSCDFCGRNMLRGEIGEQLHNAGQERTACELCRMRALRDGWHRDKVPSGDASRQPVTERGRLLDRLRGKPAERAQASRTPSAPRRVSAEPRASSGREKAAIDHFNSSQHKGTIASVAHSLGSPTVSVADLGDGGVMIVAAWDLCWYRWRVDMAQGGITVVDAGRGYELTELEPYEVTGGVMVGTDGSLTKLS